MIEVKGLKKSYGNLEALKGICFEVSEGEILGLLGPNGAGKSTTMRIITGFYAATAGTVHVKGKNIEEFGRETRKLIGYLPESSPVYADMLTFDYLDYMADLKGLEPENKGKRIEELAELCGIKEVMHRPVCELSRGYQQRVGLAFAMLSDPEILILDEPTSGLDPNQIQEIRRLIRDIGRYKTVIFSTHILSEVEAVCDRVVIINQGEIAADGKLSDLKARSQGAVLTSLRLGEASAEAVRRKLEALPFLDHVRVEEEADQSLVAGLRSQRDIRKELYAEIKKEDWILLELGQEKTSLEHVFRDLTRSTTEPLKESSETTGTTRANKGEKSE